MARMTTSDFLAKFHKRHPTSTVDVSKFEYLGDKIASTVSCSKCKFEWEIRPSNLMQGRGCRQCKYASQNEERKVTEAQFHKRVAEKRTDIDLSKFVYVNPKTHGLAVCKTCSHEWEVVPDSLMGGMGCPPCGFKVMADKRFYNKGVFDGHAKTLAVRGILHSPMKELVMSERLSCQCTACDNTWDATIANLITHESGCPKCATANMGKHNQLTPREFIKRLETIGSTDIWEGDWNTYTTFDTSFYVTCKSCGYNDVLDGRSLTQGHQCDSCRDLSHEEDTKRLAYFRLDRATVLTGNVFSNVDVAGSVINYVCSEHGEQTTSLHSLRTKTIPDCCRGPSHTFIYMIELLGHPTIDLPIIKIGKSMKLESRFYSLTSKSKLRRGRVIIWKSTKDTDEQAALDAFPSVTLSKEQFGSGYSETRVLEPTLTIGASVDKISSILGTLPKLEF